MVDEMLSAKRIAILETTRVELARKIALYQLPEDGLLNKAYSELEDAFRNAIVAEAKYLASLK